jgi:hypothetical protein
MAAPWSVGDCRGSVRDGTKQLTKRTDQTRLFPAFQRLRHYLGQRPGRRSDVSKSLVKIIAVAEERTAKIVGLTSVRPCEPLGVALELAATYGAVGKRVRFVDASAAAIDDGRAGGVADIDGISSAPAEETIAALGSTNAGVTDSEAADNLHADNLHKVAKGFDAAVLVLPPLVQEDGQPASAFMRLAPRCDLVFVLCLSGVAKSAQVADAVEMCRLANAKVGGLVLCDWELYGHSML